MSIWSWLSKSSSTIPAKLSNLIGSSGISPVSNVEDYLNLYGEDPFIHRGVSLIGNAAARSKNKVVDDEGNKKDHPILNLLDNPNENGSFLFMKSTVCYLVLGGETFWELVSPEDFAHPRELYNMRPDRIQLIPDDKKQKIEEYVFKVGNEKQRFEKDEVAHIKTFNPTDDWRGLPAVKPLEHIVNADRYGWDWIKSFLKRRGVLEGFLTSEKPVNEPSVKRLRNQWKKATSKGSNGVPLLPGGLEWKNLSRPPKESGMVDLNEHILESKLATIGVPKGLLGMGSDEDIDVAVQMFYSITVTPYLQIIEDKINQDLMPRFDEDGSFKFDTNSIGLLDFELLVEALSKQFDRASLSPNQFIELTGLGEKYEEGEEHYLGERKYNIESEQAQERQN